MIMKTFGLVAGFTLLILGGIGKVVTLQKFRKTLGKQVSYVEFMKLMRASPYKKRADAYDMLIALGISLTLLNIFGNWNV